MSAPLIEAKGVTRVLDGEVPATLIAGVDMSVQPGEFLAITGPSGSGKSSLLYLLGLLDIPTSGEVTVAGRATSKLDEAARARLRLETLGFVFQFHFLLPEFTAAENVALPMRALGRYSDDEIGTRAHALLQSLGLGEHARKRPDQMSGGQRQRVAIARALANDPLVVLADEPTGNLDTASTAQVLGILRDMIAGAEGKSVVVVTHDLGLAAQADRRINIVDGRIAAA
jgi:lipoprotein-releasing system ATP-binding protein